MPFIKKYKSDETGAIAAITGIVIFALVASTGAAIEITRIVHYKSQLQHAADSAVLAAISQSSSAYHVFSNTPGQDGINIPQGAKDVRNFFRANSGTSESVEIRNIEADVTIKNSDLISKIDYTAKIDLIFGKLLQYPSIEINGSAQAQRKLDDSKTKNKPIDVHFFLDNSPSMGIGSREKDITLLQKQVIIRKKGCAFACHLAGPGNKSEPQNLESLRTNNSLILRIDELRNAVVKLVTDVEQQQTLDKISSPKEKIRFSAYSFPKSQMPVGQPPIRTVLELSNDYQNLVNYIGKRSEFDMQIVGEDNFVKKDETFASGAAYGETKPEVAPEDMHVTDIKRRDSTPLSVAMNFVQKQITSNKTDRYQLMFLVTDGVANYDTEPGTDNCTERDTQREKIIKPGTGTLGNCIGPIDLEICEAIKRNGTRIAIVYTEYKEHIRDDDEFNNIIKPQLHNIEKKLKDCASPNLYSRSDFSGNIYETMRDVFQRATTNLKLVE